MYIYIFFKLVLFDGAHMHIMYAWNVQGEALEVFFSTSKTQKSPYAPYIVHVIK
jgi:hypothetical protein